MQQGTVDAFGQAPEASPPVARDYFADPARYLRANYRIARRREIVTQMVGDVRGLRILDLGCGDGAVSAGFVAHNHVTMVDSSHGMIEAARTHGAECLVADAVRYTASEPFDLILCLGVLAHVPETEPVIEAIVRNLAPGGRCIVQFSDRGRAAGRIAAAMFSARRRLDPGANLPRPTTRAEVVRAASRHGLRHIEERSHLLLLPGVQRLLGPALFAYDRFVAEREWLARHGLDTLVMFERSHP